MKLASLVCIGLIIYLTLVGLIIGFVHSATKKTRPKIKESEKQEKFIEDNKLNKGGQ